MNRLVFLMSVLSMLMLTGCFDNFSKEAAIGVVDTARVFRDSDAGKKGFKYLEVIQTKMQTELNVLQEELKKDPENKNIAQKLQETYVAFQQRIGAEQQNVITLLNEASQRVLDVYRTNNKLLIIISSEATLSYDNTIDITAGVITELNKEKIEFAIATTATPPASPAVEEKVAPKTEEASPKKEDAQANESEKSEPKKQ